MKDEKQSAGNMFQRREAFHAYGKHRLCFPARRSQDFYPLRGFAILFDWSWLDNYSMRKVPDNFFSRTGAGVCSGILTACTLGLILGGGAFFH